MLGWEYPPRFAGGLGKACQGLAQAMARLGAQVTFVLPTFPQRVSEPHLEVVGAWECLLEAGWEPKTESQASLESQPGLRAVPVGVQLFPYGKAPDDRISRSLQEILDRMGDQAPPTPRSRRSLIGTTPFRMRKIPKQAPVLPVSTPEIYGRNLWAEIEKYCFSVRHLGESHEVDLVHAHDWMTFPAAFEFQRMTGVPVFLHVHATEYDRSGDQLNQEVFRIERDGFRKADHIFAVSRYTAGIIEKLYGINKRKISVIYNAPEGEVRPYTPTTDAEVEARKPHVVFLGRLTFQKGPDHFLKAAALVAQANDEAKFILCGTGDMMEKLRHLAHRLGIEDRVHFAGFVDPRDVDQVLQASRVLVMPSVSEPFGLVALEAIRCGMPVILSKQSGVREVLNRTLQVDFWDHEKLADQILAALRLPELSRQLVEEGSGELSQLSWEKSGQRVLASYRQLLGSTFALSIGGSHGH